MLSVKELVIKDEQHDFILVNPLSFTFNEGDKIAMIGSEDSGKSILLHVLRGAILPFVSIQGDINRQKIIVHLLQNIRYFYKETTVESLLFSTSETMNHYLPNGIQLERFLDL